MHNENFSTTLYLHARMFCSGERQPHQPHQQPKLRISGGDSACKLRVLRSECTLRISLLLCICMLACFVPANPSPINLINNPSFESPVVTAPANYVSYPVPPGTGITDWTVVAGTGTVLPEVA